MGPRPIDLHLKSLKKMGVKIQEVQHGYLLCEAIKLVGVDIHLEYPSVGATENIMMAAAFAEGETTIRNAAKEPEIVDLQNFLSSAGLEITGAGTSVIKIKGCKALHNEIHHTIIPDRIVAGTYMIAAGITGGSLTLTDISPEHLIPVINNLRESGCRIKLRKNSLSINAPQKPKAVDTIRTLPYPGFPTDMQAQMVSYLSIARGTSIVVETIFESRYRHIEELLRMGANICIEGRLAVIKGVRKLTGASVKAWDLRGGAAMVLAGLVAEGQTTVFDTKYIERGYQNLHKDLNSIGANIQKIDE